MGISVSTETDTGDKFMLKVNQGKKSAKTPFKFDSAEFLCF